LVVARSVRKERLDLQDDLDLFAEETVALRSDAEVAATYRCFGGDAECGGVVVGGVGADAVELGLQLNGLGDATPTEFTFDHVLFVALGTNAGGAECHGRVVGDIEELRTLEVLVASLLAAVDRSHVDFGGDAGVEDVLAGDHLAGDVGEVAA